MLASGCATQYGCKGQPSDPVCLSTTEAYQVSDKPLTTPPKAGLNDSPMVPSVNNLQRYGRWAFAEFTEVYQMEDDFKARVETEFNKLIEAFARVEQTP